MIGTILVYTIVIVLGITGVALLIGGLAIPTKYWAEAGVSKSGIFWTGMSMTVAAAVIARFAGV